MAEWVFEVIDFYVSESAHFVWKRGTVLYTAFSS